MSNTSRMETESKKTVTLPHSQSTFKHPLKPRVTVEEDWNSWEGGSRLFPDKFEQSSENTALTTSTSKLGYSLTTDANIIERISPSPPLLTPSEKEEEVLKDIKNLEDSILIASDVLLTNPLNLEGKRQKIHAEVKNQIFARKNRSTSESLDSYQLKIRIFGAKDLLRRKAPFFRRISSKFFHFFLNLRTKAEGIEEAEGIEVATTIQEQLTLDECQRQRSEALEALSTEVEPVQQVPAFSDVCSEEDNEPKIPIFSYRFINFCEGQTSERGQSSDGNPSIVAEIDETFDNNTSENCQIEPNLDEAASQNIHEAFEPELVEKESRSFVSETTMELHEEVEPFIAVFNWFQFFTTIGVIMLLLGIFRPTMFSVKEQGAENNVHQEEHKDLTTDKDEPMRETFALCVNIRENREEAFLVLFSKAAFKLVSDDKKMVSLHSFGEHNKLLQLDSWLNIVYSEKNGKMKDASSIILHLAQFLGENNNRFRWTPTMRILNKEVLLCLSPEVNENRTTVD